MTIPEWLEQVCVLKQLFSTLSLVVVWLYNSVISLFAYLVVLISKEQTTFKEIHSIILKLWAPKYFCCSKHGKFQYFPFFKLTSEMIGINQTAWFGIAIPLAKKYKNFWKYITLKSGRLWEKRKESHSFRAYLNGFQAKILHFSYAIPASQTRDNRIAFVVTWLQPCETHSKWYSFQKNEFMSGIL